MVGAVVLIFNSRLALNFVSLNHNLNINHLHISAESPGPEQSPPNHLCYGNYFPAILRCYRPSNLTQLGLLLD